MRCAIVGSGLAALASYATLRHVGVEAEQITVFGTEHDPTRDFAGRAAAIRQTHMRSESDGHVAAASFPGLALRDRAFLRTIANRYRPTVERFLSHAEEVRLRSGWSVSFVERRVQRLRAVDGGFEIDGNGPYAHVLLALGHPGLNTVPGIVHAYEPHGYAPQVAVIGAGMAAATEWRNAHAAGAEVVSVRRREPTIRPLNLPRQWFSKRALAGFHALDPARRVKLLYDFSRPSYPKELHADVPVAPEPPPGYQVIAATGFRRGWQEDMLLTDLVETHDLETHDRWIALAPDSTVPSLTDERRTLSLAGVQGQWAFPAADTIAGAKYAARAFARRCRTR